MSALKEAASTARVLELKPAGLFSMGRREGRTGRFLSPKFGKDVKLLAFDEGEVKDDDREQEGVKEDPAAAAIEAEAPAISCCFGAASLLSM